MKKKKQRNFLVPKTKSYICQKCKASVLGGRYNNHCPSCLWSKHVDSKTPGDRASNCGGLMEPTGVTQKNGKWRIIQECTKCNHVFTVTSSPDDNLDLIIEISQRPK